MAVGWTWAFDTPFKWTKQIASHFGGTRQGMAISWPGHITDAGDIRNQFHHVIDAYKSELYDVRKDWTQNHDLTASSPAKLKEMQDLFMIEAATHQVLPLDNSLGTRLIAPRPSVTAGRDTFTYSGVLIGTPNGDAPNLLNSSYTITAEIDRPQLTAEDIKKLQAATPGASNKSSE